MCRRRRRFATPRSHDRPGYVVRGNIRQSRDARRRLESARLDGASDATILFRIVLPLSLPALATVGLFIAVIYWNDWWHGMMLLNFAKFRPLAVILLRMVQSIRAIEQAMRTGSAMVDVSALPSLSIRMATTVLTIGPIILVYPFVQRYFIKGLMLGGIKG